MTSASYVFGFMVEIAMKHLKNYHSDLYHDALWLNENYKEDFYFVVRDSGTHIGTSYDSVVDAVLNSFSDVKESLKFTYRDGSYTAEPLMPESATEPAQVPF